MQFRDPFGLAQTEVLSSIHSHEQTLSWPVQLERPLKEDWCKQQWCVPTSNCSQRQKPWVEKLQWYPKTNYELIFVISCSACPSNQIRTRPRELCDCLQSAQTWCMLSPWGVMISMFKFRLAYLSLSKLKILWCFHQLICPLWEYARS